MDATNNCQRTERKFEEGDEEKKGTEKVEPTGVGCCDCADLDKIVRSKLDLDSEDGFLASLKEKEVYICLICGTYLKGGDEMSEAFWHSFLKCHNIFLNLKSQEFYCLTGNHQIVSPYLEDIVHALKPNFSSDQIEQLDKSAKLARACDGSTYFPGLIKLKNFRATDYCNVVLQALSHITPLRNFFLSEDNFSRLRSEAGDQKFPLAQSFGELLRKIWNEWNCKAHIAPYEMMHTIEHCSEKKFMTDKQGDCCEFLSWFLMSLHQTLGSLEKSSETVVSQTFMGSMKVTSQKLPPWEMRQDEKNRLMRTEEYREKKVNIPFHYLMCDLPPPYHNKWGEEVNPQVSLDKLLLDFTDHKEFEDTTLKKFKILKLPPYIILCFKRFSSSSTTGDQDIILEKNPYVVNSRIKNIDFIGLLTPKARKDHKTTVYNVISNIVHTGEADTGSYKVQFLHKGRNEWFEMQGDMISKIESDKVTCTESCIQIFELEKEEVISQPQEKGDDVSN